VLRKSGLTCPAHPHRFAFCPSAPLRQAVLRTSSWLAPSWITTRPCDRPVKKTRDAPNRLLPPKRTTCTRTSSRFRLTLAGCPAGRPHGVLGSVRPLAHRGTGRFTTSETASADRHRVRTFRSAPHGLESEAWAFSSHGARAIEPLTPLSRTAFIVTPLQASPELPFPLAARLSFGEVGAGRTMRFPPRPASPPPRERRRFRRSGMSSIDRDPSWDPVAATAPVPRPPHRLSGDGATAEWHSRATLGLRPVSPRSHG
jgi:hypothetical protein